MFPGTHQSPTTSNFRQISPVMVIPKKDTDLNGIQIKLAICLAGLMMHKFVFGTYVEVVGTCLHWDVGMDTKTSSKMLLGILTTLMCSVL
mmetsp:Transcript_9365/g.28661  ORF Transcript_9365/g.28661 Transcript_9365/m.28661 type:complete len:90 (+) Transcript_9365:818-1087(+)